MSHDSVFSGAWKIQTNLSGYYIQPELVDIFHSLCVGVPSDVLLDVAVKAAFPQSGIYRRKDWGVRHNESVMS